MTNSRVDIVLVGLGNLGRRFAQLLVNKRPFIRTRYGLDLRLIGAADSRGVAYDPAGLDLKIVVRIKTAGGSIGEYPLRGQLGVAAIELVREAQGDVLCEASPVNLQRRGEPGLSCIRAALARGMHVVTPNKGPIVLAYQELVEAARKNGVALRFDGTVAGGLPALYLGARDLRGATISKLEAVPNLVTGLILDLLAEGKSWEEAQAIARAEGTLEADPNWDLEGWDAAAKLVILANTALGFPARLEDVDRTGITGISREDVKREAAEGKTLRLLAVAQHREEGGYSLRVAPEALPRSHPLGGLGAKHMGVVYYTDIYGTIIAIIEEPTPLPSAATMLRDILDIVLS